MSNTEEQIKQLEQQQFDNRREIFRLQKLIRDLENTNQTIRSNLSDLKDKIKKDQEERSYIDAYGNDFNVFTDDSNSVRDVSNNARLSHIKDNIYINTQSEHDKFIYVNGSELVVGDVIKIYSGLYGRYTTFCKITKLHNKMLSYSVLNHSRKLNEVLNRNCDYTEYYLYDKDGETDNTIKKTKKDQQFYKLTTQQFINEENHYLD